MTTLPVGLLLVLLPILMHLSGNLCDAVAADGDCPDDCHCDCTTEANGKLTIICRGREINSFPFACLHSEDVSDFALYEVEWLANLTHDQFARAASLVRVDVSRNPNLKYVEAETFDGLPMLTEIILERNAIDELPETVFPEQLLRLSLAGNAIRRLPDLPFAGAAPALTRLTLADNKIPYFTCPHLAYLEYLDIGGNDITALDFHGCPSVRIMNASLNQLARIDASWSLLTKLESLELFANRLTDFPTSALNLTRLTYLDLAANNISRMPVWNSTMQPVLEQVSLSATHVRIIENGSLRGLPQLQTFEMVFASQLDNIERGAFAGLERLSMLFVADNPSLRYIPAEALPAPDLGELWFVDFRRNNITRFDRALFEGLALLYRADIAGNPLRCDCAAAWMRELMDRDDVPWVADWSEGGEREVVCRSPENVDGLPVGRLNIGDLTCNYSRVHRMESILLGNKALFVVCDK